MQILYEQGNRADWKIDILWSKKTRKRPVMQIQDNS